MRAVTAGLVTTIAAAALGAGAMQGVALAQGPSSPSAGDGGIAAGQAVMDFLDAVRSGKHSTDSTHGAAY